MYALCDPFPNFRRIRRVTAPVLLIHGTADRTVDCSHTMTLYEKLPPQHRREPYIIEGAGHENVVDLDVDTYFARMRSFLSAEVPAAGAASTRFLRHVQPVAGLASVEDDEARDKVQSRA